MFKVFDLMNGSRLTEAYAQECLAHGVEAIHISVNNFSDICPYPDLRRSLNELAAYRRHLKSLAAVTHMVERYDDFERATRAGKLAVVLGYQNEPGVGTDLGMYDLFRDLGVRVIQISHNARNQYADGCAEPSDAGLSTLGREMVAVMNDLGIVIDLAHVGDASGIDVVNVSRHPVAVTHSNAYAVCPNRRNRSDALLDALASKGGVLGVTYLPPTVLMPGSRKPEAPDVVKHIRYAVDRIGVAHVGIGSDFITGQPPERYQEFMRRPDLYGTWPWLFPINDLRDQQTFFESLTSIGLKTADIQAIARDNFLRVFRAALA